MLFAGKGIMSTTKLKNQEHKSREVENMCFGSSVAYWPLARAFNKELLGLNLSRISRLFNLFFLWGVHSFCTETNSGESRLILGHLTQPEEEGQIYSIVRIFLRAIQYSQDLPEGYTV